MDIELVIGDARSKPISLPFVWPSKR